MNEAVRMMRNVRHATRLLMPPVQTCALALLWLTLAGFKSSSAQEQVFRQDYPDLPDTFVEVESVFGAGTRQGSIPFRISIRNNSGKDREWTIMFQEGSYGRKLSTRSLFRIPVEAGSEVVREVTIPFAPAFLAYDYRNLTVSSSAPGLPSQTLNHSVPTNQFFPSLAISKPLARRSLVRLDEMVKQENSANPVFARAFEPAHLPGSWQGYTGLDALLIDLPSWQSLPVNQRQAVISWVRLGGRVDIYTDTDATLRALNLPGEEEAVDSQRLSLGKIRLMRWNGLELSDDVLDHYRDLPERSRILDQEFGANWELQKEFGIREFNPAIIFLLLVAFAILVAPVNLFYLAGNGRRHRLFITTPLISLATCLVVVVVILFLDGMGGKGIRVVFADLQPGDGEMRLYLTQEQISRTGVMTNTGFTAESEYDINPVNLPPGAFNPLSQQRNNSVSYEFGQREFTGGFFQSRSEQAFSIRSIETTRARLEVDHGGAGNSPTVVSNLSNSLANLFYIDQSGETWVSPPGQPLSPGTRVVLEKATDKEWPGWLKDPKSRLSETLERQVDALRTDRNRFFAIPSAPDEIALPTHPAIVWDKSLVIMTGTPLIKSSPTTLPSSPTVSSPAPNE